MKFFRSKKDDTPNISCVTTNVVTKMEFKITLNNEKEIEAFKLIVGSSHRIPSHKMSKEYINLVKQLNELF